MSASSDNTTVRPAMTDGQRYLADFMMDVLVYTVVINLFVEFVDSIVIDSFTVSLLTAIVMKGLIDGIDYLVRRVKRHFADREGSAGKVLFALSAWAIMFFSKILILVIMEVIFEEDVELGGFFNVLLLVIAMMVARRLTTAVFVRIGDPGATSLEPHDQRA